MPELPEAETIARQLHAVLADRYLGRVVHVRSDMVYGDMRPIQKTLPGLRVKLAYRRAKRVILELSNGRTGGPMAELVFALGMTGRLTVCDTAEPIEKHTHLRVAVAGEKRELRFRDPRRFGGIWINQATEPRSVEAAKKVRTATARERRMSGTKHERQMREPRSGEAAGGKQLPDRILSPLGPEPLELTAGGFRRVIRRKRQIKALLLDQTAIAGLGNIYCDEALHAAGVHPLTKADVLSQEQAGRLLRVIKTTLRRAIRFNGSTLMDYRSADGEPGSFQNQHRVYNREGQPCRTCRRPIERIQAAGRSTWLCPTCQPQIWVP